MQTYSDENRRNNAYALPDVEIFQLTAEEAATQDEDAVYEAMKVYPLASMNSRDHDKAIQWIIDEYGITGGYFYWYCLPGCLPDSDIVGPFDSRAEAEEDAQDTI